MGDEFAPASRLPLGNAPPSLALKVTIGMPTFDDYDGVYFTLQALRLYHPEVTADAEFIVVDNDPSGASSIALQELGSQVPNFRYIAEMSRPGSAHAKQRIFAEASGDLVICLDCHVLVAPGALLRLTEHFRRMPDCRDLLQGPLLLDDLKTVQTHFDPVWSSGMFGTWGLDPRGVMADVEPFDIPMQGMGLFACLRSAWPGFNPQFQGFGGEEFYIHEKFRQRGGRTLCVPYLRWMHRFARPRGVPYRNVWEDRLWNYVIGFRELGLPINDIVSHFSEHVGREWTLSTMASIDRQTGQTTVAPEK